MIKLKKSNLDAISLNISPDISSPNTLTWAPGTIKEWDSLKHMLLLMALEEEFEVRFTDDEMANCINVASILEILDEKVLETK